MICASVMHVVSANTFDHSIMIARVKCQQCPAEGAGECWWGGIEDHEAHALYALFSRVVSNVCFALDLKPLTKIDFAMYLLFF